MNRNARDVKSGITMTLTFADVRVMFYSVGMSHPASKLPRGTITKARAAVSNDTSRFDPYWREAVADGWDPPEDRLLRTEVSEERPRKVITRNASPDLSFDRSINPYRGCEHGCIYCFARPSHAYLGYSPGLDFETRLIARPSASEVLETELRKRDYKVAPIAIGTNTDPYQPIERDYRIMRRILGVLQRYKHPVGIVTKGAMIERDIDILEPMAQQGLVRVGISVTTLDASLSRKLEPRAPAPARRIAAIERLAKAGIEVRVMCSPMIPALNDHEMEAILTAGRDAGAVAASYISLRLPREVAPLFREWLQARYPDRAARVLGHVRGMHGGKDYDPNWGTRMTGTGPVAELMKARFATAIKRLGLVRSLPPLRCDLFAPPPRIGDQMPLFDDL